MRITPTSVIKDGGRRYDPGTEYQVDDETGRRMVILGWATSPDYTPGEVTATPEVVTLAPADTSHKLTSSTPKGA